MTGLFGFTLIDTYVTNVLSVPGNNKRRTRQPLTLILVSLNSRVITTDMPDVMKYIPDGSIAIIVDEQDIVY